MAGVVKFFGWLNVIVGVVLLIILIIWPFFFIAYPSLLALGAMALLGGALLIVFARIAELLGEMNSKLLLFLRSVEFLEEINNKLIPVTALAHRLDAHYRDDNPAATPPPSNSELLRNPPEDAERIYYKGYPAIKLGDGTVIGETATGVWRFASVKEYHDFIDH
jgi:hypothetical protein